MQVTKILMFSCFRSAVVLSVHSERLSTIKTSRQTARGEKNKTCDSRTIATSEDVGSRNTPTTASSKETWNKNPVHDKRIKLNITADWLQEKNTRDKRLTLKITDDWLQKNTRDTAHVRRRFQQHSNKRYSEWIPFWFAVLYHLGKARKWNEFV